MNALSLTKHFRILNGRHAVLLCNPSVLATQSNSVPKRSLTTCALCYAALHEDEANEAIKRMQSKGSPS